MKITTYSVGELQTNCYFLIEDKTCLIIDPGDSADFLLEEISRKNLEVKALIATHGHFDHVMAVGEMQLALQVPFHLFPEDKFLLARLKETARHFLGAAPEIIPIQQSHDLVEGEFQLSNFKFQILLTPGHTPGSCCLYFKDEASLFTGDTLFKNGIGRYDFSYSKKHDLFDSLTKIFSTFPAETTVYSGHGDPTSLSAEKSFLHM